MTGRLQPSGDVPARPLPVLARSNRALTLLDREIDKRRDAATSDEWEKLYQSLMTETRPAIDSLLVDVIRDLKIGRGRALIGQVGGGSRQVEGVPGSGWNHRPER